MGNNKPYPPSWVDRFTDWLDSLPVPNWLLIILVYMIAVLSFHIGVWIDGVTPFGEIDDYWLVNGIWAVIGVSFLLVLDQTANKAIDKFAVLVPKKKAELESLRYQMTTIPAGVALALTLVIAIVLAVALYFDPSFAYVGISSPISYFIFYVLVVFSYSFAPLMLYQGFRQLGLVVNVSPCGPDQLVPSAALVCFFGTDHDLKLFLGGSPEFKSLQQFGSF